MTATTSRFAVRGIARSQAAPITRRNRRRHISLEAGQALEILGHAIEYLTDEYVHTANQISATDPQVEAVQMLMALNRRIYYECPIVPTFVERLQDFFGIPAR